jgi:DNA-binding NarL/FixJ family response regulator
VVVDDHALFRAGLVSLLSQMPAFEIVGEAGNGKEAIEIVRSRHPDVVLLDVNMPVQGGVETVAELRKVSDCHILMLTISKRQEDLIGAIQAGADGYLLKNAEPEELQKSITLAVSGKSILSPEITGQVMQAVRDSSPLAVNTFDLTKREMDILKQLSIGKTTPQISNDLHITNNTVKTHIRKILEKMNASNRVEAVTIAIREGLINP